MRGDWIVEQAGALRGQHTFAGGGVLIRALENGDRRPSCRGQGVAFQAVICLAKKFGVVLKGAVIAWENGRWYILG